MRLRRSLVGLPVLLVLAAILAGTVPVDAARKVTLGVTVETPDATDPDSFDDITGLVDGIKPRIWTLFSKWGSPVSQAFPLAAANWIRAEGAVPMIFWEPLFALRSCEGGARFDDVRDGDYDDYIREWAQAAKAYGGKVILRYAQEINGKYFPWGLGKTTCGNTPTIFKDAWRHVHDIFQQEDATNVKFLWSVSQAKCTKRGCNPYRSMYPGNAYVDYVGFSAFNWGTHSGHKWVSMTSLVGNVIGYFKKFTNKPVIVAELATNKSGGNKPAWIRDGYASVYRRYPQVKAIVYLNVDLRSVGHPDWSLGTPSGAYDAYERVARQAKFKGTF